MNQTIRPRPSTLGAQPPASGPDHHHRTHRLSVNITPAERVARVVLGGAAAAAGVFLLVSASSVLAVVLEVLLIAAGLDLVITGALRHCPLYQRLGHVSASLQRPT